MVQKTALTIIVSIILTIIIISLVNVGLSIFLKSPDYTEFCGDYRTSPILKENQSLVCTADTKTCSDGSILSRDSKMNCEFPPCSSDFDTCQKEYDAAQNDYNQKRYYVFALIGFILLLVGLFTAELMFQLTGLATGAILVTEGIVTNFQNKIITFISLILILVIFGFVARKIIKKSK